jgi:hypothetical protein
MNRIRLASAALCLLFAAATIAAAPQPQPQQQDEPKERPDKEAPHEKDAKPSKQDESKPSKVEKQEKTDARKDESQKDASGHAGKGGRIPDDKFRSHFGRQHTFRIGHPEVVGGQPHFQYGGYAFIVVDPWPAGWAYTDDCYIDFIDGEYFIFDVVHPGVQLVVNVIL